MSAGMEQIRESMARYLEGQGVAAVTAWPQKERAGRKGAVTAVSLRRCETGPSGFQDYLGERFNRENGCWEELYGKRVELIFGLDLYAGAGAGEESIQETFDRIVRAFQQGGPEGLEVLRVSCGETEFDSGQGLLHRKAEVVCRAYLYAVTQPGGAFLDFEIRGGIGK